MATLVGDRRICRLGRAAGDDRHPGAAPRAVRDREVGRAAVADRQTKLAGHGRLRRGEVIASHARLRRGEVEQDLIRAVVRIDAGVARRRELAAIASQQIGSGGIARGRTAGRSAIRTSPRSGSKRSNGIAERSSTSTTSRPNVSPRSRSRPTTCRRHTSECSGGISRSSNISRAPVVCCHVISHVPGGSRRQANAPGMSNHSIGAQPFAVAYVSHRLRAVASTSNISTPNGPPTRARMRSNSASSPAIVPPLGTDRHLNGTPGSPVGSCQVPTFRARL